MENNKEKLMEKLNAGGFSDKEVKTTFKLYELFNDQGKKDFFDLIMSN